MPEQAPLKTHHMTYHWHRMVESKSDTPIRKAELHDKALLCIHPAQRKKQRCFVDPDFPGIRCRSGKNFFQDLVNRLLVSRFIGHIVNAVISRKAAE